NADATTRPARDDTNEDDDEIPLPEGFPGEDDFEAFICYRCVDANPWLKAYAGSPGFLPPVYKLDAPTAPAEPLSDSKGESSTPEQSLNFNKRRYGDETDTSAGQPTSKRLKQEDESETSSTTPTSQHAPPPRLHELLPPNPSTRTFSLFLKEDFRDHLCHCPSCFPHLSTYPQLLSEEETYQPPADSRSPSPNPSSLPRNGGTGTGSVHSGGGNSLYERGEAALNTMDRVKALEGVMIYQHLRDKVKEFLRPYAERGEAVGAEDVREYFARLRGDDQGRSSTAAANGSSVGDDDTEQGDGDNRREQSGY
ncbi:putative E3 ubiquitin-protein ligase ubr7, partial [Ascosphaera aggregata]